MKNLILMSVVILFGCVKPQIDTLIVTNTELDTVTVKIDFEKSLLYLQPNESRTFDLSGWHHVEVGSYSDSVFVEGVVEYP